MYHEAFTLGAWSTPLLLKKLAFPLKRVQNNNAFVWNTDRLL